MEHLDRIKRKLKTSRGWVIDMMYEEKENCKEPLFVKSYKLIYEQIDLNLENIYKARVDYAQGINISPSVVHQLK